MAIVTVGRVYWSASRDRDGNREYTVKFKVSTSHPDDGPQSVSRATLLPRVGAPWTFGNDYDATAVCTPFLNIVPYSQIQDEGVKHWIVENRFSTNPIYRCQDFEVGNPLMEPARIGGSFAKYVEEITEGYDEDYTSLIPMKTSSHEPLRGPKMEFEKSHPTINIDQILSWAEFNLGKLTELQDHVNESEMWGLGERTIKLSHSSWGMQYWGVNQIYGCSMPYYTRSCTFEINFEGWDRQVPDEGTRARGFWDPSSGLDGTWKIRGEADDPSSFNRYRDKTGEIDHVFLNGNGVPIGNDADVHQIDVRGYKQANLFELWLPHNLYFPSPQNWTKT